MKLPVDYTKLSPAKRKLVRLEYENIQDGKCFYCNHSLNEKPPIRITSKHINRKLFPPGFFKNLIHLQHNHHTGMTEGAVHAYCNAVMWQYKGR